MTIRMNRWVVLAGYGLLAACSRLLWLSYAFIEAQTHRAMGVSVGDVGDLAAIFPLMYVILALPFGRWLDVSFERALGLGAVLTGAGSRASSLSCVSRASRLSCASRASAHSQAPEPDARDAADPAVRWQFA